jgi:prevent-host-death family protein
MFTTHVKAIRDLRNNYPEVASIIKNRDYVIITNNGKSEAVLISYDEFEKYQEFLHILYVKERLAEAEAISDNPDEWLEIDELSSNMTTWCSIK